MGELHHLGTKNQMKMTSRMKEQVNFTLTATSKGVIILPSINATKDAPCRRLLVGAKFKIRKEADAIPNLFEDGEEVEIASFVDVSKGRLPCCKNIKARLLKFKGHEDSHWHPLWIINCDKCPFYDPNIEDPLPGDEDYIIKRYR